MIELLVISYALLALIAVVLILREKGSAQDSKEKRIKSISQSNEKIEYEELESSFYQRFIAPNIKKFTKKINEAGNKNDKNVKKNKQMEEIERLLRLSGIKATPHGYDFFKKSFMIVTLIVTVFAAIIVSADALVKLLIILIGAVAALMAPNMYLKSRVKSYQNSIRSQIPDAMDLMGVCIEAGLSFDAAIVKVSEKMKGPFIDQLLVVYSQIQMGLPRSEVLRKFADGTDIPELKSFIAALAQANQLGIPINNVMRVQSAQLRHTRRELAKEKGQKAPVKMMIPMLLLIFPVLLIVVMGPTVMNMIQQFGG